MRAHATAARMASLAMDRKRGPSETASGRCRSKPVSHRVAKAAHPARPVVPMAVDSQMRSDQFQQNFLCSSDKRKATPAHWSCHGRQTPLGRAATRSGRSPAALRRRIVWDALRLNRIRCAVRNRLRSERSIRRRHTPERLLRCNRAVNIASCRETIWRSRRSVDHVASAK